MSSTDTTTRVPERDLLKHQPHRAGAAGLVELWPLPPVETPPQSGPWEPPVGRRYEAKPRKDGASGESQSDVINVTSDQRAMFLTLVSIRLTSTGLHMRYQNLRENARDFFSGVELQDWNGIGYKGGYDTAEFTSSISGAPSRCIAVQRYLNPAFGGFKRHVIGMGCTAGSLDAVYGALAKMRAPGD